MGSRWAVILTALIAGAIGCGEGSEGSGEERRAPDGAREEIATTLNELRAAIAAGDGGRACGLMTERGRRVFLRASRSLGAEDGSGSCEEAVAGTASEPGVDGLTDRRIEPEDVSFGPSQLPGAAAALEAAGGPARRRIAEAGCPFRGSYGVTRVGPGWRAFMPLCFD